MKKLKTKKQKRIYVVHPSMSWKTFKILQEKLVRDSGPVPVGADKVLWEMLRDKKMYCWFSGELKNDMGIGLEIPEAEEYLVLRDPKKKKGGK